MRVVRFLLAVLCLLGLGSGAAFAQGARIAVLSAPPALNLDWYTTQTFTASDGQKYASFAAVVTAGKATYSRSGAGATAVKKDGTVQTFAANTPRETDAGLLIEAAATNLALYSTDTSNATNWTVQGGTQLTGQADPAGGTTAVRITAGGTSTTHFSQASAGTVSVTSGTTYTLSRWVKPGTQSLVQLSGSSGAFGSTQYANFNLSGAGSVTASAGLTASGIIGYSNGWYRIWIAAPATATTSTGAGVVAFISTGTDARIPTNTLATNFYDWGAQVEAGSAPTSLIVTTSAAVARNADAATVTLPSAFSSLRITYPTGTATPASPTSPFNIGSTSGGAWVGTYIRKISTQ